MRHVDRWAFTREVIHKCETPKRPSIEQGVAHEVHAPPLGPGRRLRSWDARDRDVLLPAAATYREPFFAVEAQHFLVIDHMPFAAQQHMQLLVAPPRLGGGELAQAGAHKRIIAAKGAILPTRSTERDEATGASLTTLWEGGHEMGDDLPPLCGGHHFRPTTSLSIALSRERSATSFFSRRFSSSSTR